MYVYDFKEILGFVMWPEECKRHRISERKVRDLHILSLESQQIMKIGNAIKIKILVSENNEI